MESGKNKSKMQNSAGEHICTCKSTEKKNYFEGGVVEPSYTLSIS